MQRLPTEAALTPTLPRIAPARQLTAAHPLIFNSAFSVTFYWRFAVLLRTLACASVALLFATPGGATTLYVAGGGTGGAPCAASAPCSTILLAMSAAAVGDTIVCVSPPIPTQVTITHSVTIDCSTARAEVRDSALIIGNLLIAVSINIPVSAADPLRTVRLRGLTVDGATTNSASPHFYDRGIDIQSATAVYIEDCVISNVKQYGIIDHRTGGATKLFVTDSIISGNGGPGIGLGAQGPNTNVLDNVRSENNAYGIAAATGNTVVINRSVFAGNSTAGIEGDSGVMIIVDSSKITQNSIGVQSSSSVRLSNNDIAFNSTAVSGSAATMGFNRYSGNSSMGTPPMPISGAPADVGP
jgi:hypothetical protein